MKPTRTPHAACFAFKNILISLFHRELNAIDWPGPFKISTAWAWASLLWNTPAAGNGCPWRVWGNGVRPFRGESVPGGVGVFSVVLRCLSITWSGAECIAACLRGGVNECRTHFQWPLLSAHPPPVPPSFPLLLFLLLTSQWVDTYLYLQCITPVAPFLDLKSWLFSVWESHWYPRSQVTLHLLWMLEAA